MSSSTILRVKRRLDENPQDAIVLMCKRVKIDTEELSPSLFIFTGTVDSQDIVNVKSTLPKIDVKSQSIHNVSDIIDKIRKERKEMSTESRYKVINYSRKLKDGNNEDADNTFNLVDLAEKKVAEENDAQCAYDLYIAAKQDFDISMLDDIHSIENYENLLMYGSNRDNGRATPSSDEADDDDDSNDENNWRNEYPESEASSINEEDMIKAVEKCDIEDDLSSDAEEDKIYDDPPDIFNEDVKRYGAAYAKYKARVLSEDPGVVDGKSLIQYSNVKDLDEESVEGYKEDSDDGFYYGQDEDNEQFQEQYKDDSDSDVYTPD